MNFNLGRKTKQLLTKNFSKYPIPVIIILGVVLLMSQTGVQEKVAEVLGLENFQNSQTDTSLEGVEKVFVERVVDGDTVVLSDSRRVRYLNIDTPESVKSGTEVQCYAIAASNKNKELVEGKTIYLTRDKSPQDRYGRELAFLFLKQEDTVDLSKSVNAYLVKNGYATTAFYSPNTTFREEFRAWEAEAKKQNLGLWSACKEN